jgi:hypothetical protein
VFCTPGANRNPLETSPKSREFLEFKLCCNQLTESFLRSMMKTFIIPPGSAERP